MTNGTSQGLFVIIAVIIFGIFVALSYVLFEGQMKTGLSEIFCDTFNMVHSDTGLGKENVCSEGNTGENDNGNNNNGNGNENGGKDDEEGIDNGNGYIIGKDDLNVNTDTDPRVYKQNGEIYYLLRDSRGNVKSSFTSYNVYITLIENKDGKSYRSSGAKYGIYNDRTEKIEVTNLQLTSVNVQMDTLDIKYPDFVNGKPITNIESSSVAPSYHNVKVELPKYVDDLGISSFSESRDEKTKGIAIFSNDGFKYNNLKTIGNDSFKQVNMSGNFIVPEVTSIGHRAFTNAEFTGDFKSENVEFIGNSAFRDSKFNGIFYAPKIDVFNTYAFKNSNFIGTLDLKNVTEVKDGAFENSKFDKVINAEGTKIGKNSIRMSDGTYFKN